jgi:hypothetical protein
MSVGVMEDCKVCHLRASHTHDVSVLSQKMGEKKQKKNIKLVSGWVWQEGDLHICQQ